MSYIIPLGFESNSTFSLRRRVPALQIEPAPWAFQCFALWETRVFPMPLQNHVLRHKPRYMISRRPKIHPHRQVITRTWNLVKIPAVKHCFRCVVFTSPVFLITSEVKNSCRTRVHPTKSPSQVSGVLVNPRIQWLVVSVSTPFTTIALMRALMVRKRKPSRRARPSQCTIQQAQALRPP